MAETNLRTRTMKNSAYGFLAYTVPFFFTFFLTPLIIIRLGTEQYGLFVLTSVITGFFSLFKFGLGWGVVNSVGRHLGRDDAQQVSKFISSTMVVMLAIGAIGFALSLLVGLFGLDVLRISPQYHGDATIIFMLAGIAFIFSSLTSVFANILSGAQRQDLYSKIYLTGLIAMNTLMLVAVSAGFGIPALVAIQLVVGAATCLAFYVASRRLLPELQINFSFSRIHFVREFGFNAYAYIHESASTLLFEFDKVIVSSVLSPTAVAYYSVAGTLTQKIQGTVSSLTSIFFPVTSTLHAADEKEKIKILYRRVIRVALVLAAALSISLLVTGRPLLQHWLGADFEANSLQALYALTLTYFILALYTTISYFGIGVGQVKRIAFVTTSMFALNILFLVILLPKYGITGAAWAYMLSVIPIPYAIYVVERRSLGLSHVLRWYTTLLGKLFIVSLITYLISTALIVPTMDGIIMTLIGGAVTFGIFFACYQLFGFMPTEERALFKQITSKATNPIMRAIRRLGVILAYPLASPLLDKPAVREWLYVRSGGYLPMRWLLVNLIEWHVLKLKEKGEDVWGPHCGVLYDLKHHLYDRLKKQEVYNTHYSRTINRFKQLLEKNSNIKAVIDYGTGPAILTQHLRANASEEITIYGLGLDKETLAYNRQLLPDVKWQNIKANEYPAWVAAQPARSICLMLDGVLADMTQEITEKLFVTPQFGAIIFYYSNPLCFDVATLAAKYGWRADVTVYPPIVAGGPSATSGIFNRN